MNTKTKKLSKVKKEMKALIKEKNEMNEIGDIFEISQMSIECVLTAMFDGLDNSESPVVPEYEVLKNEERPISGK